MAAVATSSASPPGSPALRPGASYKWVDDKDAVNCGGCGGGFSFTKRKHHCRACGGVFCSGCSKGEMVVEGYKGTVRVCNRCVQGVVSWEVADDDFDSDSATVTPPLSPRLQGQGMGQVITGLLKSSAKVAGGFPSKRLASDCRPIIKNSSTILVFSSDRAFSESMGLLKEVAKHGEDTPYSLHTLRKPYAEAAAAAPQITPSDIETTLWGVPHKTTLLNPHRAEEGAFIGTKVLNTTGGSEDKAALLSTCIAEVGDGVVLGRHGRVDTSAKARQLAKMVEFVLKRRGLTGVRVRVRFCSLLNALSFTQKEMNYFKNQSTLLTGFQGGLSDPTSGNVDVAQSTPIPIQSSPVHGPHSFTPDTITPPSSMPLSIGDSMASSIPPMDLGAATFDFPAAMSDLNVDYSYLNFVANWPLSLRLGNQPQSRHNVTHEIGLRKHLQWLITDTQDALAAVGQELSIPMSAEDPWKTTLSKVRRAVRVLSQNSKTEKEKEKACNIFMAHGLLQELSLNKGSNFRRRAAELLQLCLLEHILGVVPFFNCKSGIDRTGVCGALWASVSQMLNKDDPPPLWLFYYLALNYSLAVKVSHGVHDCVKQIPLCQLEESNFMGSGTVLPFPACGTTSVPELILYSHIEELFQLISSRHTLGHTIEPLAYQAIRSLFASGSGAVLPSLQYAFFVNTLGATARIACISTGVHGLKYGDCGLPGHQNALAAQYLPSAVSSPSHTVKVTVLRRNLAGTDVVVSKEFAPYLVGAADARGT